MAYKTPIKYVVKIDKNIFHEFQNNHAPNCPNTHASCSRRLTAFIEAYHDKLLDIAKHTAPIPVLPYSAPVYMDIDKDTYVKARRILLSPQGAQMLALAYLGALTEL